MDHRNDGIVGFIGKVDPIPPINLPPLIDSVAIVAESQHLSVQPYW